MQSEKCSSSGANWSRLPMRLRVRLAVDGQRVGQAFGVLVGRIDVDVALGADDAVRGDVGRR